MVVERSVESYHIPTTKLPKSIKDRDPGEKDDDDGDGSDGVDGDGGDGDELNDDERMVNEDGGRGDRGGKEVKKMKMDVGGEKRVGIKARLGERKVLEDGKKIPIIERLGERNRKMKRKERFSVVMPLVDACLQQLLSTNQIEEFLRAQLKAFKEPPNMKEIFRW